MARGQKFSCRRLHIEKYEAFANEDSRRDRALRSAVFVAACRRSSGYSGADGISAVIFVRGDDAVFCEKRKVARSIVGGGSAVLKEWREVDVDLGFVSRDQVESLASVEFPDGGAGGGVLADRVEAHELNEAR